MKKILVLFFFVLVACGGQMTEEQRKRIREEMQTSKIQRVSDAEITEAAFQAGRKVMEIVKGEDMTRVDSLGFASGRQIHFITISTKNAKPIEWELFDAYNDVDDKSNLNDNVQPIRSEDGVVDSLLYTYPVTYKMDGQIYLHGVWNVWLSKKQLILSMQEKD